MKILIVGAGPIGCYAARLLKERNLDVELIEEHSGIGRPIHCSGLVSKEVLSQIKVPLREEVVVNHIHGAEIFFNGDSFKIERRGVAVLIDRERFDRALGEKLRVHFNTKFVGIEKEDSGYLVETDKGEFYADIVIGADGANSSVRKIAGFKEEIEYLRGVQFRVACDNGNRHQVRVFLKHPFFAWVIPENDSIVRVGTISRNPYHDLIDLIDERSIKGDILEKYAGIVPLGSCQSQMGNIFLVGDAACQMKPLTHGGINYGMRCAEILSDCIYRDKQNEYESLWRGAFGQEINIGIKIKRLYEKIDEEDAQDVFRILKDNTGLIEEVGDFENHSKVISLIARNPRLQAKLGKILIKIFKDCYL